MTFDIALPKGCTTEEWKAAMDAVFTFFDKEPGMAWAIGATLAGYDLSLEKERHRAFSVSGANGVMVLCSAFVRAMVFAKTGNYY